MSFSQVPGAAFLGIVLGFLCYLECGMAVLLLFLAGLNPRAAITLQKNSAAPPNPTTLPSIRKTGAKKMPGRNHREKSSSRPPLINSNTKKAARINSKAKNRYSVPITLRVFPFIQDCI